MSCVTTYKQVQERLADINLRARNVIFATLERGGFGEACKRVLGRDVGVMEWTRDLGRD